MPTRNNNRQQTVGWTPAVFQGEEWSPTPFDYSVMERSLARQEERKEKATQQQTLVKQALGKAREQLHEDPETMAWFDEKANQIEQNIQDYANVGDFAGALNIAMEEAGNLANDAELAGRIKTNQQYKKTVEEVKSRIGKGISQETFDWWLSKNPYSHENILNNEGKVIGSKEWQPDELPVDDFDFVNISNIAAKLAAEERSTWNNSGNINKDGTINSTTSTRAGSYQKLTVEKILSNYKQILGEGDNWRRLIQAFNVKRHYLNEVKAKRDQAYRENPNSEEYQILNQQYEDLASYYRDPNTGFDLQDNETGWKWFYARMVTDALVARNMAYDWRTSTRSDIGKKQTLSPQGPNGEIWDDINHRWLPTPESRPGENVQVKADTQGAQESASQSASRAGDGFDDGQNYQQSMLAAQNTNNDNNNQNNRTLLNLITGGFYN